MALKSIGIEILSIILDQEPTHQKVVADMGNKFENIPVLFDPPHLLKNLRNSLLTYQIKVRH